MQLTLDIPTEHDVFAGHFPGDPLVPGALLTEWLAELVEHTVKKDITSIARIKFIQPVRPGNSLTVTLQEKAGHYSVTATLDNITCLKGKFFYA